MLTTDQKGAIAETAIVHAAIKLGVGVYKPVMDGGRYDLILEVGLQLLRTQCKWATVSNGAVVVRCYSSRRGADRMIVRRYTAEEIDVIAAYCSRTGRCYLVPPSHFSGRRVVHLRIEPSKNNQRAGINRADDFELDARLRALLGP